MRCVMINALLSVRSLASSITTDATGCELVFRSSATFKTREMMPVLYLLVNMNTYDPPPCFTVDVTGCEFDLKYC